MTKDEALGIIAEKLMTILAQHEEAAERHAADSIARGEDPTKVRLRCTVEPSNPLDFRAKLIRTRGLNSADYRCDACHEWNTLELADDASTSASECVFCGVENALDGEVWE